MSLHSGKERLFSTDCVTSFSPSSCVFASPIFSLSFQLFLSGHIVHNKTDYKHLKCVQRTRVDGGPTCGWGYSGIYSSCTSSISRFSIVDGFILTTVSSCLCVFPGKSSHAGSISLGSLTPTNESVAELGRSGCATMWSVSSWPEKPSSASVCLISEPSQQHVTVHVLNAKISLSQKVIRKPLNTANGQMFYY